MQIPVRYYITQSDDRALVRSVPVSVRPRLAVTDAPANPAVETKPQETRHAGLRNARVSRLVRQASRRGNRRR